MGVRSVLVFLLLLPALYLTLGLFPYPAVLTPELRVLALAGIQGAAMLLGLDVLMRGLFRLLRLELGMDTLLVFAAAATLADALTMYRLDPRDGQMPYCAAIVLGIFFLLRGARRKRRGLRMACRTAASAAQPYLVTLDEGKWNGWDTYAKWSGEPIGFGRQMQAADGAERIFHRVCPLLFIACLLLSVVASIGRGAPERLLWCLSAMLTACASLSGALCFALPWLSLTQRLSKSGAAIAGWDGVTATGGSGILLNDTDFFPPGCVSLNGIKIFGEFPVDKVVSDTATLIRDAGCGLDKLFHDLLRAQGCVYRRASDFCVYEGGLSAVIRDQQVLVGSASFMHLMEITLPQGLNVKNAVFCAIDGELAGIFALNYTLPDVVFPALDSLMREKVGPVLATRDFNLRPRGAGAVAEQPHPQPGHAGDGHPRLQPDPRHAAPALQAAGGQDGVPGGGTAAGVVRRGAAPQRHPHRRPLPGGGSPLLRGRGGGGPAAPGGAHRRSAGLPGCCGGAAAGLLPHLCMLLRLPVRRQPAGVPVDVAGAHPADCRYGEQILNKRGSVRLDGASFVNNM